MAKFSEVYLSSGVDDGAQKIGTQSAVSQTLILNQYVEGGQNCKWSGNTILVSGATTPTCAATTDWRGSYITTQGCSGFGGTLCTNLGAILNGRDIQHTLRFQAGVTADQTFNIDWNNHSAASTWRLSIAPTGTLGDSGQWHLTSKGNAQTRLVLFGKSNTGNSYLNGEGSGGTVIFGKNFAGTDAGTGGIEVWSGGASPAKVASVDGTGLGTFNGGVKAGASGSTISDTREIFQSVHSCGTTTTCANTANGSNKMVFGSVALSSGTPSTATVSSMTAFASTASYFCVATNTTTQANPVKVANVSTTSFTITGPNTVTDVINYQCVGN